MKRVLFIVPSLLFGCIESEKSCFETRMKEINSMEKTLEVMLKDKNTRTPRIEILQMQLTLMGEKARLRSFYDNDSANVCDFYIDGIRLLRK